MKELFANLDTNTLDEQIEQILQLSPDQRGSADNQCLQDLQYLYRKDRILARAAQRLQLADSLVSESDANRQASIFGVTPVFPGMFINNTGETTLLAPIKMKKRALAPFVSYSRVKRRLLVSLSAALTLVVIVAFALLAVSSLGHNASAGVGSQPAGTHHHQETPSTGASATATAIVQQRNDGYNPSSNGGVTSSNGSSSLNWPIGQSTYWANLRYHQLTGHWVQWFGNANQWYMGAQKAGWNFSARPHTPSIIVLMPYVQGAGDYGHVGVVESIVSSSKVHTSNMNWYLNGGGFNKVSYDNFTVGAGVYFIWHK